MPARWVRLSWYRTLPTTTSSTRSREHFTAITSRARYCALRSLAHRPFPVASRPGRNSGRSKKGRGPEPVTRGRPFLQIFPLILPTPGYEQDDARRGLSNVERRAVRDLSGIWRVFHCKRIAIAGRTASAILKAHECNRECFASYGSQGDSISLSRRSLTSNRATHIQYVRESA